MRAKTTRTVPPRTPVLLDDVLVSGDNAVLVSEERFRLALGISPVVVATCDADLRYTWIFNPRPPFTADAILGRRDDELAPYEHVAELLALKAEVVSSRMPLRREITVGTDDEMHDYDVVAEPLLDAEGTAVGVITVATDITERKRAEAEREQLLASERAARAAAEAATRARDAVLQMVSHDLRNPLGTLRMAAELLAGRPEFATAPPRHPLTVIRRTVDHMTRLVQGLLDVGRIGAGVGIRMAPAAIPLQPLLDEADTAFSFACQDKGVELVIDASADLPPIRADGERVRQVLWNLIGNALKFTPTGGRITVAAAEEGTGNIVCRVSDTGVGIPAEELPWLFEPFWQGSRADSGAGLGLWISRVIVEAHGGRIRVESEVGSGSTFEVVLPAANVVR
jgi:signal transduction histidine kinase